MTEFDQYYGNSEKNTWNNETFIKICDKTRFVLFFYFNFNFQWVTYVFLPKDGRTVLRLRKALCPYYHWWRENCFRSKNVRYFNFGKSWRPCKIKTMRKCIYVRCTDQNKEEIIHLVSISSLSCLFSWNSYFSKSEFLTLFLSIKYRIKI